MHIFSRKANYKMALSGVLVALGVVLSTFCIPFGGAKVFPVQHLINVLGAVLLGPTYALTNAFIISVIRNMSGLGSLLAFPGSMIGAFFAGMFFKAKGNYRFAALGELFGTGFIGGVIAGPFAAAFMGKEVALFFFVIPFFISSLAGSLIAVLLFEGTALWQIVQQQSINRRIDK